MCHGHGQLASRFLQHFEALDDGSRLIVAPEALSRYYLDDTSGGNATHARIGATWMTKEDRLSEISDYVNYLDALALHVTESLDRSVLRAVALGFSQGGATVARWAARGRFTLDGLVLWSSALPHDLDLDDAAERLRTLHLWMVHGRDDRFVPPDRAAEQQAALLARGIRCDSVIFEGGHRLDEDVLRRLAAVTTQ